MPTASPSQTILTSQTTLRLLFALRLIGGLAGCTVIALGLYSIIKLASNDVKLIIDDLYRILFGILIVLSELRLVQLLQWFSFLVQFIGLGGFYLFVAGLALGSQWYEFVLAAALAGVGVVYCGLGCCCRGMDDEIMPDIPTPKYTNDTT